MWHVADRVYVRSDSLGAALGVKCGVYKCMLVCVSCQFCHRDTSIGEPVTASVEGRVSTASRVIIGSRKDKSSEWESVL